MDIIKSYLNSVKLYLPRKGKDDIIKELSDDIQSLFEGKESAIGRPLSESEQADILKQYGDPLLVANRYRKENRTVSFGRELISSEMFPVYIILLCINLVITAVIYGLAILGGKPILTPMIFVSLLIQFVVVTLVVSILDRIRRKFPKSWLYPPAALAAITPIPRWQSKSGLVVWSIFTLWWIALPFAPFLIFGSAAGNLKLSSAWQTYYIPILILLIIGIVQRSVNLAHPFLTWVHSFSRAITNGAGLIMQYFIITASPYVLVSEGAINSQHYQRMAEIYNALIMWGLLCWFWIFLLINLAAHLWQCVLLIRRWRSASQKSI